MVSEVKGYKSSIRLEKNLVHLFFEKILSVFPSVLIYPAVVAILFWEVADTKMLVSWLVLGIVLDTLRFVVLKKAYHDTKLDAKQPFQVYQKWLNISYGFYVITGLRWGFAGFFFFTLDAPFSVGMMYAVLFGLVSGMVFLSSSVPMVFYLFATPIVLSIMARVLVSTDNTLLSVSFVFATLIFFINTIRMMHNLRNKEIEGFILQFENEDLIDKLEVEKRTAEKANMQKSSFLAAASHDLRQPVQSLVLLSDALQHETVEKKDDLHEIAKKIGSSTENLSLLLENLLDISRLDAGAIQYTRYPVSMHTLLSQVYEEFLPQAENKGIHLRHSLAEVTVDTDPGLFHRMVANLVDNALKYTSKGGTVSIVLEIHEHTASVLIEDSGIGIAAEDQEVIFEEFKQLDNQERDRAKGLGLGLSICLRVADLLGHLLQLDSELGKGTTVQLVLDKSQATEVPITEEAAVDLAGYSVLVVDNEKDIRDALRLSLEFYGATVYEAENLDTCQFIAENSQLDLVVSDYRLSDGLTGDKVVAKVQEISSQTKAILLTGDIAKTQSLSERYTVLVKPVTAARLASAIAELPN